MRVVDEGRDHARVVLRSGRGVVVRPERSELARRDVGRQARARTSSSSGARRPGKSGRCARRSRLVDPPGRRQDRPHGPLDAVGEGSLRELGLAEPPRWPRLVADARRALGWSSRHSSSWTSDESSLRSATLDPDPRGLVAVGAARRGEATQEAGAAELGHDRRDDPEEPGRLAAVAEQADGRALDRPMRAPGRSGGPAPRRAAAGSASPPGGGGPRPTACGGGGRRRRRAAPTRDG